jgi:DNA-binding response OmpR family regulator
VIAHSAPPDIVLSQVVPELRAFSNAPLLVMGQRLKEPELVACLESGVDDYVQLPCSPPVLMIRIYALLRLTGMTMQSPEIEAPLLSGELFISPPASQVFFNNQQVALTPAEFRMLHLLIKNRGSVVDSRTLERAVGLDQSKADGPAPVKKYISSLRKKLSNNDREPRWIAPDQGEGYLYVGPAPISETPRRATAN